MEIGDRVVDVSGRWQLGGIVRAIFNNRYGQPKVVVETDDPAFGGFRIVDRYRLRLNNRAEGDQTRSEEG